MSNTMSTALVCKVNPVATAQEFNTRGAPCPGTLWVRPAGGTWAVAYSVDNGANYNTLTALDGAAAYTEVHIDGGITNVRITPSGTAGGTWGIC
jgi:hypothetical protein